MKKYHFSILVVIVFVAGLLIRSINFDNRIFFTLEQGITLDTTYKYLHGSFSLLGLPNVQRFTSMGHRIFSGPLFNYLLMPIMAIFGTDPIRMTYTALLINLITAIALFKLIYQLAGRRIALFSMILFLFDPTMIDQSLTLWILNPLPLIGLIGMYILIKYKNNYLPWTVIGMGLLCGGLTSLEYMGVFTTILVFGYLAFVRKPFLSTMLYFGMGYIAPLLPTIVFDIRNDYYHLRTLYQYTLDTINTPGQGTPRIYHFYHFIPLCVYIGGFAIDWLFKKTKYIAITLIAIYILVNSYIAYIRRPIVTTPNLIAIAGKIAQEAKPGYNVVYMPEAEYRGYAIRYMLDNINHNSPLPIDAYPSSTELFVIKTPERSLLTDIPWEIASFAPKESTLIYTTTDGQAEIVKLTK